MVYVFVSIVVIALILFISTFFMPDKVRDLEGQIEQISVTTMQDTYYLKKKIKVLEEELLAGTVENTTFKNIPATLKNKPLLIQKVYHLQQQGYSIEDISSQTKLSEHDIQTILNNNL